MSLPQLRSESLKKVLFVTAPSPQTDLFVEYLQQQLGKQVEACSCDATLPLSPCLVLVDSSQCTPAQMASWNDAPGRIAAFNVEHTDHAISLLQHMPFFGVFYRQDSLSHIRHGITRILNNEMWLSRYIMQTLIHHYRRQQQIVTRPAMGLTQRELEVLTLVAGQQSNADIAEQLRLSQHTVKSHLYNIFRKIRVHNRHQAMAWAQEYLNLSASHQSPHTES